MNTKNIINNKNGATPINMFTQNFSSLVSMIFTVVGFVLSFNPRSRIVELSSFVASNIWPWLSSIVILWSLISTLFSSWFWYFSKTVEIGISCRSCGSAMSGWKNRAMLAPIIAIIKRYVNGLFFRGAFFGAGFCMCVNLVSGLVYILVCDL